MESPQKSSPEIGVVQGKGLALLGLERRIYWAGNQATEAQTAASKGV